MGYVSTENAIPIMTSPTSPSGLVTAVSSNGTARAGYYAFDGNSATFWESNATTTAWLSYEFPTPKVIVNYSVTTGQHPLESPKTWTFEGSNDGGASWVVLDTQSNQIGWAAFEKRDFTTSNSVRYKTYRINIQSNQNGNSFHNISELSMYEYVYYYKTLVMENGVYKTYINNNWQTVSTANPTENDYITLGMDNIHNIPLSAWQQLSGDVEISCYNDDPTKTELLLQIGTDGFTLAEEWEDEIVKVIEYTDESARTQSYFNFETEAFYFNDKIKGNVDVLYFNDDPLKTNADLEFTANHSPFDELNGDFDIISWTDKEDIDEFNINMTAFPFSQLIIQDEDFQIYGDLQSMLINMISKEKAIKFLLSFDEGNTWEYYKFKEWRSIDISNENMIRKHAMDIDMLSGLTIHDFNKKGKNKLRIAYFLDDNIRQDEYTKIDNLKIVSNAPIEDVKFTDVAFYLLNTLATIQLTFGGNKLKGQLEDTDQGKVQYRVFLNNKPYYPSNGEFTPIAPSPIDISLNISEKDILFGQNNDLKVEFQDAWGQLDTWSTTFIGTYSGLMFMDETGQYYSNSFGGILKYLDFGIVIAGQTTMEQKVIVKNQLGQDVQNLILEVMKDQLPQGVNVELSYDNKPVFVPEDYLLFNKYIYPNDEMEFYVRITTSLTAPPAPNGQFEIRAKVDSV